MISMANSAKRISIMEVFFGLGALLFPLVILLTVNEQTWHYVFLFQVGALTFFLMLWLAFMNKLPSGQMTAPSNGVRKPSLLVDRNNRIIVVIMICFAFFYAGIETNFANFLPSIMLEKGETIGVSLRSLPFGQRSSLAELSLREKLISCTRCVF